jgi:Dirigent-like protein
LGLGVAVVATAVFATNALSAATFVDTMSGSSVVIRVKSVQTSVAAHNQPPAALSKGDVVVQRDNLFNVVPQLGKPAGALVGTDRATITVINAKTALISGTATFLGSTLSFKDTIALTGTKPLSIRITGGTGRYRNAKGTMNEPGTDSDPNNARNTYRISLP